MISPSQVWDPMSPWILLWNYDDVISRIEDHAFIQDNMILKPCIAKRTLLQQYTASSSFSDPKRHLIMPENKMWRHNYDVLSDVFVTFSMISSKRVVLY